MGPRGRELDHGEHRGGLEQGALLGTSRSNGTEAWPSGSDRSPCHWIGRAQYHQVAEQADRNAKHAHHQICLLAPVPPTRSSPLSHHPSLAPSPPIASSPKPPISLRAPLQPSSRPGACPSIILPASQWPADSCAPPSIVSSPLVLMPGAAQLTSTARPCLWQGHQEGTLPPACTTTAMAGR